MLKQILKNSRNIQNEKKAATATISKSGEILAAIGGLRLNEEGKERGCLPFLEKCNNRQAVDEAAQKALLQSDTYYDASDTNDESDDIDIEVVSARLAETGMKQEDDSNNGISRDDILGYLSRNSEFSAANQQKTPRITQKYLVDIILKLTDVAEYSGRAFIWCDSQYMLVNPENVGKFLVNNLTEEEQNGVTVKMFAEVAEWLHLKADKYNLHLKAPRHIIYFRNGCFDLRTAEFVERDPNWLLSFQLQVKLKRKPKKATYFLRLIADISDGDNSVRELLLHFLAYLLFQGAPAKKLFFLGCAPNSAKSKLIEYMTKLIGLQHCCAVSPNKFADKFSASVIPGKALVHSMEIPDTPLSAESVAVLKKLNGDSMEFEAKYQQPFSFTPFAKIVMASNYPLRLKTFDKGIMNTRLCIVPFLVSTPTDKQNPDLVEHLLSESEGIVQVLLPYCRKLYMSNFSFPECEAADALFVESLENKKDSVRDFLIECCTPDPETVMPTGVLHTHYQQWCSEQRIEDLGIGPFVKTIRQLVPRAEVSRRYIDGKQVRSIAGILYRGSSK